MTARTQDGTDTAQRRYRAKKHAEKYGPDAGDQRGRHQTHRAGADHYRWNAEHKLLSSHGYVKLRVGPEHPLADPNGYAYEHLVVWVSAGNPRPSDGWVLHHKNEDKTDNRLSNLDLVDRLHHAYEHHNMLSDDDVRAIREAYAAGEGGTVLAKRYGIPHSRVYRFIKGEARRSAGGPIVEGSLRMNANRNRAGRLLDGRTWDEVPHG